jgi:hypothetical protein
LVAGIAAAVALAGCGSSKVVTQTTLIQTKTVTVQNQPSPTTTAAAHTTSAPPAPAALPSLIAGSWNGTRPSEIDFSGDGGNIVTGINWTAWNANGASGTGTSNIQGCVPNCAQGSETPVTTTVTLSSPQNGHFTQIGEVRQGFSLNASYGGTQWPEGAS